MPSRKRYMTEQIIAKLRVVEKLQVQGRRFRRFASGLGSASRRSIGGG